MHVNPDQPIESLDFINLYSELTLLLRDLEGIQPNRLISYLYQYLRVMSDDIDTNLVTQIANHTHYHYSWLNQAIKLCRLPQTLETLTKSLQSFDTADIRHTLLSDIMKQIQYYQKRFSDENLEEISRLYSGIETCFDPEQLQQYREEIVTYLDEQQAPVLKRQPDVQVMRLLQSGFIHTIKLQAQQLKRISAQHQILVTKFSRFAEEFKTDATLLIQDFVDIKNQLEACEDHNQLEEITQHLQQGVQEDFPNVRKQLLSYQTFQRFFQAFVARFQEDQSQVAEVLAPKVAQRVGTKVSAISLPVLHDEKAEHVAHFNNLSTWESFYHQLTDVIGQKRQQLVQASQAEEMQAVRQALHDYVVNIKRAEQYVEFVDTVLKTVKAKLSCAIQARECYRQFSIALVSDYLLKCLRATADKLTELSSSLSVDLRHELLQDDPSIPSIEAHRDEMLSALAQTTEQVEQYLSVVNVDEAQYQKSRSVKWQVELSKLILKADAAKLTHYHNQLTRISRIENRYVKGLFILFFSRVEGRLTDDLVQLIQSWQIRPVGEDSIIKMMRYFNIAISDNTLVRIAPHIESYRTYLSSSKKAKLRQLLQNTFMICVGGLKKPIDLLR